MAVVPYTFGDQTGTIPLSQLDVNFANVKAFAETAGNVTGNIQSNITAVGTLTSLSVSGNISAPEFIGNVIGNVTGNISGNITVAGGNRQVLFNDNGVANASAGLTFNKSTNALSVGGTITSSTLGISGNILASNITASFLMNCETMSSNNVFTNNVVVNGNLTANTLQVNSGIIGVSTGVTSLFLGNTTASTVFFAGDASNVYIANVNSTTRIAGNLTAGGNILTSGQVSATGNLTAGNILTSGTISATGTISTTGNLTAGNILTSGIISLSGNLTAGGNTALSGNSTAVTAANGTNTTQIATTAFVTNTAQNLIPTGVIVMWSGSIASIPAGWALCNGTSGTPDLRDRFLVGAGGTYAVGSTGGSANAVVVDHTHTATSVVTDPGHNHVNGIYDKLLTVSGLGTVTSTNAGSEPDVTQSGNIASNTTGITVSTTVNSTGVSGTNANLPPYYALAYIMKL